MTWLPWEKIWFHTTMLGFLKMYPANQLICGRGSLNRLLKDHPAYSLGSNKFLERRKWWHQCPNWKLERYQRHWRGLKLEYAPTVESCFNNNNSVFPSVGSDNEKLDGCYPTLDTVRETWLLWVQNTWELPTRLIGTQGTCHSIILNPMSRLVMMRPPPEGAPCLSLSKNGHGKEKVWRRQNPMALQLDRDWWSHVDTTSLSEWRWRRELGLQGV
jgi:hypothetical protein